MELSKTLVNNWMRIQSFVYLEGKRRKLKYKNADVEIEKN